MRKICCFLLIAVILAFASNPVLAEGEIQILLGETITVNGAEIAGDAGSGVYLARRTETHEDVPAELQGLENRVVTITDGGVYRIDGEAEDVQIRVEAKQDDEVRLILDGADIACRTAPAIAVISAADPREAGQYGVTIELADGLTRISGAHTEKTDEDETKLSGAITSLVSIGFEGSGFLDVNGDNEGIEVKNGHMTFNGGNIIVNSGDDPLNASEDNVSVITINDGTLHLQVKPDQGGEGDGIDSNGSIVINGGSVVSRAHPDSMDSGIDSDLGCVINGGVVLGAGNMYDEILEESGQLFMALQFAQKTDEMIVITDTEGKFVAMCEPYVEDGDEAESQDKPRAAYSSFVLSSPVLTEGDYHLYLGGEITYENEEIIYIPGRQLQHGGSFGRMGPGGMGPGGMGRPQMPEGFEFPEGMPEMPEGFQFPEGMPEFPEDMQPPQGGWEPGQKGRGEKFGESMDPAQMSPVFHLAPGSTMFGGITEIE